MERVEGRRRLIVNADDFGASHGINAAIAQAHQQGILTTASLMVNGAAVDEAVALAKSHPRLGVGLHLALCCGRSTLTSNEIPALVDREQNFSDSAVAAGVSYFFSKQAREQLAMEIEAQFEKFAATGLVMDHLNGHLHFHLHPAVYQILKEQILKRRVRAVRLTRDPFRIDFPLGRGRWLYRLSHSIIFSLLSARARPFLTLNNVRHSDYVFGLLEHALVTEDYILKLLGRLPRGDAELYAHPSMDEFRHEYEALVSPRVAEAIRRGNIELIRYQDL